MGIKLVSIVGRKKRQKIYFLIQQIQVKKVYIIDNTYFLSKYNQYRLLITILVCGGDKLSLDRL